MRKRVRVRHWKRWLAIGIVGLAAALVGGPYVYIHFIEGEAPPPLTLSSPVATSDTTDTTGSGNGNATSNGIWSVADGSVVGYRVKEVLFGQSNEAVGRTSEVTGSITVDGTSVTGGTFTVDMTTVTSDQARRDGQFNDRIMETSTYPAAAFELTEPIDFHSVPSDGERRALTARGELTLHGVTKTVEFEVTGQISGSTVQVAGSIPIPFADWDISNPSFGPVTTEDIGMLEFALNFAQA